MVRPWYELPDWVWVAAILTLILVLYLIIGRTKWNPTAKAVVAILLSGTSCFFVFVGGLALNDYIEYRNDCIEHEKMLAIEEQRKKDPLLNTEWEGNSCSITIDNDFSATYYIREGEEDFHRMSIDGDYELKSVDRDEEKIKAYKEKYGGLLGDYVDELECFCLYSVRVKEMRIDDQPVDPKDYSNRSSGDYYNDYLIGFMKDDYIYYVVMIDLERGLSFEMGRPSQDTGVCEHAKPVIYLYPEAETKVHVQLSKPENITCDYPKYNEGWNVIAKPNGDLRDVASGKDLYCLYYECSADTSQVEEDGFVVKSADIADFLDEKLKILGLNDKERNEFIIYWLPKLEQNKYNYIRFLTKTEIDKAEELDVNPKPDTVIRVMMSYKGLDKPINVREQKLKAAERAGFTVVEWGGTEVQ